MADGARTALGSGAIDKIRTLVLEGEGEYAVFGQDATLGGKLATWHFGERRRSIDFARHRWRDEGVITPQFLTGWPDPRPITMAYDDGVAFEIDRGEVSRENAAMERERRADFYHHPIAFLRAARAPGAVLENARRDGELDAIDLVTEGMRFTMSVDRTSGLPRKIASRDHVPGVGDVAVTTEFADFGVAAGWKLPRRITKRIDGAVVSDFRVVAIRVNGNVAALAAPDAVRAAPADPAPRVVVDEVAPGVWYLTGQGLHSIVVEFADHLALIEAPLDDARTLAVIAQARALRPGKPLTQVVNTHHHLDHAGGLRAAISEGLTVITHESNRAHYEQLARRPATILPDQLAQHPRAPVIEGVADKKVLTDGARSIEIYPITGSVHCPTNLMIYLPAEKLLVVGDVFQPAPKHLPPPRYFPHARNLVENLQRRGLTVERVLPLHGTAAPYAVLAAAALTSPK